MKIPATVYGRKKWTLLNHKKKTKCYSQLHDVII